jgi:hypothetical protein
MKFMKGISTTLVLLIVAVIAGVLILWLMWSKGMLPWLSGATEATCHTDLSKVCGGQLLWSDIKDTDKSCWSYFRDTTDKPLQSDLKSCLTSVQQGEPNTKCDEFCTLFQGG